VAQRFGYSVAFYMAAAALIAAAIAARFVFFPAKRPCASAQFVEQLETAV
jgi:hypothetical protein